MAKTPTRREFARNLNGADPQQSDRSFDNLFGEVTDVNDPENLGRVKVRLDYMQKDEQTDWIMPSGGFQGEGFGSTFDFPSEGDKVRISHVGGNVHNMIYSPGFYTKPAVGSINKSKGKPTPTGHKGSYDASRGKRRNILRTLSGWLLSLVEGQDEQDKWEARIESPSKYDWFHWWTGGHAETGRPRGVIKIQIDDLLEMWDYTNLEKGEQATFKWDSLYKIIQFKFQKEGRLIIEDYHEGKIEWDDKTNTVTFTLPKKGILSCVDNIGGNFTWDAEKSQIQLRLIDNLTVAAQQITLDANSILLGAGATKLIALDGDPVMMGNIIVGYVKSSAVKTKGS